MNEPVHAVSPEGTNAETTSLNNIDKCQGKPKCRLSVNTKTSSSSCSINNMNGCNKRPLKQFSVKNHNNSVSSFKTYTAKPCRNSSLQDLNDFLIKQSSNSPRSMNSQDGLNHTSMQRNRSIEETKRKRNLSFVGNNNSYNNGRQLAKTRSRNSTNSRQSKQSSHSSNSKFKNSKSISPLATQPHIAQKEEEEEEGDQKLGNNEYSINSLVSNGKESEKRTIVDKKDTEFNKEGQYLTVEGYGSKNGRNSPYKSYTNNSSKTFQLESESDDEDDDDDNDNEKDLKGEHYQQLNQNNIDTQANNQIQKSSILITPEITKEITTNDIQSNIDESGDITSENTSSFDSKNLLNSNSNLLKINKDDILMDQKILSYLVPSSYRKNSRVSADRISSDLIMRRTSQSNSDLINQNTINNITSNNSNALQTSGQPSSIEVSLQPQHMTQPPQKQNNSLRINNTHDDEILPLNLKHVESDINFENKIRDDQQLLRKVPPSDIIDKVSNDLEIMNNKKQQDNAEYSSFSSSFMKDKNTSHQFNYINKDFLNSSTSTEIKKYFSGTEKSSESNSNELTSNGNNNNSKGDLLDNENSKVTVDMQTGLISNNNNIEQTRLNRLKQATRDQLKSYQNNQPQANIFANKATERSPGFNYNNKGILASNQRSPNSGKDSSIEPRNAMQHNDLETNISMLEPRNNRVANAPRTNGSTNNIYASNNSAAKSLLKIATMANNHSPPIKKSRENSDNSFNDFNSFLKADTLTEDRDSRTQQRLWLQRENSILDLSTDLSQKQFDSVFQASSVDAKRGFENIAKEYNSIKRFKNPLLENIKKVYKITENDNSNTNKDTNSYHIDFINDTPTVTATTYSKSSASNNNNSNTKTDNSKTKTKEDFDSILSNIWNTETKKMIEGQPNKFINSSQPGGQSSNYLMRQSMSNNAFYRNSPRGIHSAGSLR